MKYVWVDAHIKEYGLDEMCLVLDVSESGSKVIALMAPPDFPVAFEKNLYGRGHWCRK